MDTLLIANNSFYLLASAGCYYIRNSTNNILSYYIRNSTNNILRGWLILIVKNWAKNWVNNWASTNLGKISNQKMHESKTVLVEKIRYFQMICKKE